MDMTLLEKQQNKLSSRYANCIENKTEVFKEGINAIVYLYENENKLYAIGYKNLTKNSNFRYRFKTVEQRTEYVDNFFSELVKQNEAKNKRNQELKERKLKIQQETKIGTLLNGSWGWEQTNRELWVVTEVVSKSKVKVKPAKKEIIIDSTYDDMSWNTKVTGVIEDGKEITLTLGNYGFTLNQWCKLTPASYEETFFESHYA